MTARVALLRMAGLSLLILTTTWLVIPSTSNAEHVDSTRPSVMEWNMCGRLCNNNGSTTVAAALVQSISSRQPYMPAYVVVNEVCRTQFNYLKTQLTAIGYWTTDAFPVTKANVANCNGANSGDFGIAVFWLGGKGGELMGQYAHNPEAEKRMWVCGGAVIPAFFACGTHLDNDAVNAQPQAGEYSSVLVNFNAYAPAFGGGDLNLSPGNGYLTPIYDSHDEADGQCRVPGTGCRYRATLGTATHYDYLLVPDDSHGFDHDAYIFNSIYSDHHLYQGYHYHL